MPGILFDNFSESLPLSPYEGDAVIHFTSRRQRLYLHHCKQVGVVSLAGVQDPYFSCSILHQATYLSHIPGTEILDEFIHSSGCFFVTYL